MIISMDNLGGEGNASDAEAKKVLSSEDKTSKKSLPNALFDSSIDNVVKELNKISLQTEQTLMGNLDVMSDIGNSSDSCDEPQNNNRKLISSNSVFSKNSSKSIDDKGGDKMLINVESVRCFPPTVIINDDKDVTYLTPDALKYTPSPDHLVATLKKGEKFRLIFCNQDYTDQEKTFIENYKRYVVSNVKGIDKNDPDAIKIYAEHFKDSIFSQDHYILRYLQGNSFDPPKTYIDVGNHMKWREETLPIYKNQIEPYLDMGFCYIFGRDVCARPIVIIRLSKATNLKKEVMLKVLYYWLELILSKMLIPGKIEQWRILVDLNSYNIFNLPISFLKDASRFLTVNYRSRLTGMVILNAPFMISGIWSVIKGMLPVHTQEKIVITSSATSKHFLSGVDKSQVEIRYGGTAKNNITFNHPVFPPFTK